MVGLHALFLQYFYWNAALTLISLVNHFDGPTNNNIIWNLHPLLAVCEGWGGVILLLCSIDLDSALRSTM